MSLRGLWDRSILRKRLKFSRMEKYNQQYHYQPYEFGVFLLLQITKISLNVTSKKWKLCSKPTVSIGMYGVMRLLTALLSGAGEQRKSKQGRVSQWEWNNATLIVDDKWKLLTTIHSTIKKISFIFRHWGMPHQPFV